MRFFLLIACCTSSIRQHVLPCPILCFLFPQSFSQVFKIPFLNELLKSFASVLTQFIHLVPFFYFSFSFNFHTLYWMFRFIFIRLNKFSFFTSTTTNLCCSSQGFTLKSLDNFLLSFSSKTKSISVSLLPEL